MFFVLLGQRAPSSSARSGWLMGLVALAAPLLAARFGGAWLLAIAPMAVGLAYQFVQQRRRERDAPAGRDLHTRSQSGMTRSEALRVLGLKEGASREAIAAAHRNLIKKLHPDQGGSGFLAQQVNEAKEVLSPRSS